MRLGIIARSDKTGLGNQTRNLVHMLNPDKVMLIDSSYFNGNAQYPEIYKKYNTTTTNGFPTPTECSNFLKNLDAVLTCEIFYSDYMIREATRRGIKTFNQFNYEFLDYLNGEHPMVTTLIAPSYWHLDELKERFGNVIYLPPPTFEYDFSKNVVTNMARKEKKKRFLHVVGKKAINDRNGTELLLQAVAKSKSDFELVVKSQEMVYTTVNDERVTYDYGIVENETDLYLDFDAMILPRRYGGLCLPMNEALLSALPVIMPDIDPNNKVLPPDFLIPARDVGSFMTRTQISLYDVDTDKLAEKIDWLCSVNDKSLKHVAYTTGILNFSRNVLELEWKSLFDETN